MPEYRSYRKIRTIYEKHMNFYPEILKYTLREEWYRNEQHFEDYCTFLLRMGLTEEVRELCLVGMGVMQSQDTFDHIELFRSLLLQARSVNSRELHNIVLENEILEEKAVKLSKELLDEVRDKIKELK
jgi:hypothetical protein